VELDGLAFHSDPEAAVADRRRDRDLVAAGWHVMRVTWGDLRHNAELLAADLRRLLAERDRGRG
jgi:very-short-patch-repair endonuclease